jgi:hypothetical protein
MKLKISNRQLTNIILFSLLILLPSLLHAQPGFGDDTDDVPIDGGLSLLVAAGIGYSAKKMRKAGNKL